MSHTNCISTLLDLKDKNITFSKNCIQETQIKNVRSKLILGTLSFQPTHCYHCGHSFDSNIIKHGFKTSRIKLVKISGFDAYLDLKKQRYKCRHCDRTFTLETSLVNPNCFISTPVKQAIFLEASHKKSETDIARELNVSHSTVNRVIHSSYEEQPLPFNSLPKVLCFDEFKSVKSAEGAMSFIFCDASNAKIILDKFHIVQLVSRALNKTRIRFMNQNKEFYNKFKHYWRLLLKAQEDLNATHYFYSNCFKKMISQQEIIDFLLALDPELKETYDFYQTVQQAIKLRNLEIFHHAIQHPSDLLSPEMKTALKTLTHYQDYVKNTIETPYTNGVLEGINNNIKVIKRIAFGYRSFYHFKARILIIHKYTFEQKKKRNQAV